MSTALSLVSETSATAETAPTLREATASDAPDLALALAREINRRMRAIVDSTSESDDPFALATRGRDEDMRTKRVLLGGLNGLKAAHARYLAVFEAWQTACAELADASDVACKAVNVDLASVAASLGLVVKPTSDTAPISDMARERRTRDDAKRAIDAQILQAKLDAKVEIDATREARKATVDAARAARKALNATK